TVDADNTNRLICEQRRLRRSGGDASTTGQLSVDGGSQEARGLSGHDKDGVHQVSLLSWAQRCWGPYDSPASLASGLLSWTALISPTCSPRPSTGLVAKPARSPAGTPIRRSASARTIMPAR